ncbi:ABC transporter ATP-binding protein [Lactiplantibacillus mudanjiangensis]|uniref:Sugar ABC transporter ATP-binding protein [Lactobacillus plantarum] n=1 Tax=Lactiplantibacillus mudanjiangensis TaxID=1296538 RepID=A0A660E4V3_9LACO|nr:sn-glycerol-3-phosphate ABC transporter ATP-binding protein UgpC [Lactiplantibacillus mudanjiangensis]VDG20143.1 sugar ABC transporter ATP-binding protein [Lactobacillus plantarum] [Lactiplantibacillus mudanjiangensis]VDG23840.1 sugar ABC transporter ATP-binding protein [Lactobacillus plantarum] [Lactiplantibacillus mudanjiangensis]VDG30342.1 sugar ABC transporter ATP-binding protein [Lactobacillus plantarum] [Lactiplantibacillus mudanjiangensis]VDG33537.1 sugar ABC transporter ATP-binding p
MAEIALEHIYKKYDGNPEYSVTDFNLHMKDDEFIVFVGPSGCGKSTVLRMIAGLESITKGDVRVGDKVVNRMAPKDRDIAMVFQNYALYPNMNVYNNMAFGLKIKHENKDEIDKRVKNAAEILGLEEFLDRKPAALSGGQRQRVALGRAIVRDAKLFLLDEPLSNLDAKLRVQMRTQIAQLHQRLKTNMIYVTHDQVEAMTMADRIVIMKTGVVQQIGTPSELYNEPINQFVAGFIGSPGMNFFDARLEDGRVVNDAGLSVAVPGGKLKGLIDKGYDGKKITVGIRPEDIHTEQVALQAMPDAVVDAKVQVSELLGAESMLYSKIGDNEFVAQVDARDYHEPGSQVKMAFEMSKAHFFDAETELTIE